MFLGLVMTSKKSFWYWMDVLVVTFLSLVDFYMISMPMVSATASYYTLMSFELVQPMKNKSFLFNILAVKRFTIIGPSFKVS